VFLLRGDYPVCLSFNAAIVLCIRGIERITSASVFVVDYSVKLREIPSISVLTPVKEGDPS